MKKELAKRVLGRRLAHQLKAGGLSPVRGVGTSWNSSNGGTDVYSADCTDLGHDTFNP